MTRHVKLCLSLLLATLLLFTVTAAVLAEPMDPGTSESSDISSDNSSGESTAPSENTDSLEVPSESSDSSSEEPIGKHTVRIQGEHVQVYFNGSDTPATSIEVDDGQSVTFRVVADEGYQVRSVSTVDGLPIPGSAGNYSISRITSDYTVVIAVDDLPSSSSSDTSSDTTTSSYDQVEVRVTVHGAGTVTVNGTAVTGTADNTVTQSVWVSNTDQSGQRVQFNISPAAGFAIKELIQDGSPRYTSTSFQLRVTALTTMEVTFVPNAQMPGAFHVSVSVSEGGSVSVGGTEIAAGQQQSIEVNAGNSLTFWITPTADYELDAFLVDGSAVNVSGGNYELQNVAKDMTVSISFKQKTATSNTLTSGDINWTAGADGNIMINVQGKRIDKSVFDKINTLTTADCKYVVLEATFVRWYIPAGQKVTNFPTDRDFVLLDATAVTSGATYDAIKNSLRSDSIPDNENFLCFTVPDTLGFPAGSIISFDMKNLGTEYVGRVTELMISKTVGNDQQLQSVGRSGIQSNGWTVPMEYQKSNLQAVIVHASELYLETSSDVSGSGVGESLPVFSDVDSSDVSTSEGHSYAGLIVALVIAFVAVGGAAALFIVKWRQEKF